MTEHVTINHLEIRGDAWWKLGALAEKRDMTIPQFITYLAESAVMEPKPARGRFGRTDTPVERRKMTPRRLERLQSLHALDMSDGEIAADIGLSPETVRQWRNRLQLPVVRRGPKPGFTRTKGTAA